MSIPPSTTIATTTILQNPQNKLDKKTPHLSWSTKNILINSGIDPLLFSTTKLVDTVTNSGIEFHPKLNILNFEAINYTEEGDNSMELTSRWFLNNSQVLIYREEEGETEERVGSESVEEVEMSGEIDFMCWDPTGRYVITYDQNHQLSVYLLEKGNGLLLLKSVKVNSKIQCYQFIKKRKEYSNFDVKSGDIIPQEFLGPKYEEGAFALVFLMQEWELGVMTCDSNDRMGIKLIDLKQYLPQLEGVEMNLTKMVFLKDEFVCIIVKDKVNKFYFISFEMDLNLLMRENQLRNINLLVLDLSYLILNGNGMTVDQDKCDLIVNWYLDQIEVNYIVNYKNSSSLFISHCFNFKFTQMELVSLKSIENINSRINKKEYQMDQVIRMEIINKFNKKILFFLSGKVEIWNQLNENISEFNNLMELNQYSMISQNNNNNNVLGYIKLFELSPNQCISLIITSENNILLINLYSLFNLIEINNNNNVLNSFIPYYISALANENDLSDLVSISLYHPKPIKVQGSDLNEIKLNDFLVKLDSILQIYKNNINQNNEITIEFDKFNKLQLLIYRQFQTKYYKQINSLIAITKLRYCLEILQSEFSDPEENNQIYLNDQLCHLTTISIFFYNYLIVLFGDCYNHYRTINDNNNALTHQLYMNYGILSHPMVRKLIENLIMIVYPLDKFMSELNNNNNNYSNNNYKEWLNYWNLQRNKLPTGSQHNLLFFKYLIKQLNGYYDEKIINERIKYSNVIIFNKHKDSRWYQEILLKTMELNLKSEKLKNNLDGLLNGRANWLLFFIGNEKGSLLNKKRKIEGFIEKQNTVELNLVKFIIHMSLKSKQFIPGANYHTINNNNKQHKGDAGILNKRIKSTEEKLQQNNTNLNHQQQDNKLIDLAINASKIQSNEVISLTNINTNNKLANKNNNEIKLKVIPSIYSKKKIYTIYSQLVCGRCNQFLPQSKKMNPQFEDSLLPDLSDGFYCTCGGIISLSKLEQ